MKDCRFLFIRHGETRANLENICSGGDNTHALTNLGKMQVTISSSQLEKMNIIPDKIFYSPTVRAVESKDIFLSNRKFNNLPAIEIPEFKERVFGEFEDRDFSLIKGRVWSDDFKPKDGEALKEFLGRIEGALTILSEDGEANLPIVVSHGMVFDAIYRLFNEDAPWIYNGDIYEINISKDKLTSSRICGYK